MDTPPGNVPEIESVVALSTRSDRVIPWVSFSPATNFDENGEIDGRIAVTRAKIRAA